MNDTERREVLQKILDELELPGKVSGESVGASASLFEVVPEPGVSLRKFEKAAPMIAEKFHVPAVRVAVMPGTHRFGIEVPNERRKKVDLREVLAAAAPRADRMRFPVALGTDLKNAPVVFDLAGAPHVLVAGSDENEKDACLDTMIAALICRFNPEELNFIMIDSPRRNLEKYGALPHFLPPLAAGPADGLTALRWAEKEIDRRYKMFVRWHVKTYNELLRLSPGAEEEEERPMRLPRVVVVVGELAELMTGKDKSKIEMALCAVAQRGRAAGIHLVVGTSQLRRGSLTGPIKANLPTRIVFKTATETESRLIFDRSGAELLTGGGDLLLETSDCKVTRVQCAAIPNLELDDAAAPMARSLEETKQGQLP